MPCNATALRKASRRVSQLFDEALSASGLKSTQFSILSALARRTDNPPTVTELASELVMDPSALGHNLRPLAREALVLLVKGAPDRRQRRVSLTARGAKVHAEARGQWQKAQDRFAEVIGADEADDLRRRLLAIAYHDWL
jgi:DNA-binding MarR family transcriptional regulator